jgi:hypothetical protein
VVQAVEHVPSKHEALSSNPDALKKKKKTKNMASQVLAAHTYNPSY